MSNILKCFSNNSPTPAQIRSGYFWNVIKKQKKAGLESYLKSTLCMLWILIQSGSM
jgi:hypothetical protein